MELAHDDSGQGCDWRVVGPGGQVGRDRHLADVELQTADHAPEGPHDRGDLDVLERAPGHRHGAVLEAFRVRVRRDRGLERGHVSRRCWPPARRWGPTGTVRTPGADAPWLRASWRRGAGSRRPSAADRPWDDRLRAA